jgi:aminomethyltransferase
MDQACRQTVFSDIHHAAGAKMVNFGGWWMPLHYGSQIQEHHAVRKSVGCFDVSHMGILDISGQQTKAFLRYLVANDVERLNKTGKALYSCMLNAQGGVIDDLIIYFMGPDRYRMVVNASTRDTDIAWIRQCAAPYSVDIEERTTLAMLAVQGPQAVATVLPLISQACHAKVQTLENFCGVECETGFYARTGYTGEDGLEIMLPQDDAIQLWHKLMEKGVQPCGLGARDTLRLEAGMSLYGHEMDETITPLEAGLAWTVAMQPEGRNFIGREALETQRTNGVKWERDGLLLLGKGVCREGQEVVFSDGQRGKLTSGGFSPTLNRSIGLIRIPKGCPETCEVMIRGKAVAARRVSPPFVKQGSINVTI